MVAGGGVAVANDVETNFISVDLVCLMAVFFLIFMKYSMCVQYIAAIHDVKNKVQLKLKCNVILAI